MKIKLFASALTLGLMLAAFGAAAAKPAYADSPGFNVSLWPARGVHVNINRPATVDYPAGYYGYPSGYPSTPYYYGNDTCNQTYTPTYVPAYNANYYQYTNANPYGYGYDNGWRHRRWERERHDRDRDDRGGWFGGRHDRGEHRGWWH